MQQKYDWYALLSGAHEQALGSASCVSDSALRRCRFAVEKVIASGMDREAFTRMALSVLEDKVKKV
ncbi:hypothetical protein DUB99_16765 [Salmonella enterica subsp. enterica serovar Bonariensis]|nr:hypothetical protein [Salmonella enterica subsp. enterica serovar Bonariensis]ECC5704610.1 hypothetical protein [Salmonella enterica]EDT7935866.1 hypothetical protein [Salmonella enterica subsp. enterica serovar Aba]EBY0066489.1 hypothetical protein [Salmonella enterica subsp. enterica serovar Bonariensis]EDX1478745.1 hypothetical protein [Salmonella enterica subsp. enterica serovar Bonariensis]